jgi:hypothetical protein
MKKQIISKTIFVIALGLLFSSCQKESEVQPNSSSATNALQTIRSANNLVFPSQASMYGNTYSVWSARWWKWAMELPPAANHPFNDDPGFQVGMGQSGDVWFLASPFGTVVRTCTIPPDKSLYLGMLAAEASDLEGLGTTAAEQLANAQYNADHIVGLFASIDGNSVANLETYRFASPQFSFTAPTPWLYASTGGNGTAVGDGYYLMIKPLSEGTHTIHYGGSFHFTLANDGFDFDLPMDVTYNLLVQ